jgi:hypothetical protein
MIGKGPSSVLQESYAAILARILVLLAALGTIALFAINRDRSKQQSATDSPRPARPAPAQTPAPAEPIVVNAPSEPQPEQPPEPHPEERATVDPSLIEAARQAEETARRERQRAGERARESRSELHAAQLALAERVRSASSLARTMRDSSPRVCVAQSRLSDLQADRLKLQREIAALQAAPRPRPKPLADQSPVARPPGGEESHFELRRDRVAYIDLGGLLDRLKTDAQIQIRLMTVPRPLQGRVGPVGDFSIEYELTPTGVDVSPSGFGGRTLSASYTLSGWEIVPRQDLRGESIEQAFQPASDFGRAINRLDPGRDTVTLWVYPDGFAIYRQLRDWLHSRGFQVAARPLPEAMPIRGSPTGSVSAGQ